MGEARFGGAEHRRACGPGASPLQKRGKSRCRAARHSRDQDYEKSEERILKKLIETEHISFSYEEETGLPLVLEDVNITIGEGEFVAVLGHNGSGKIHAGQALNALLLPTDGTVLVDGMDTLTEEKLWISAATRAWCSRTRITRSWPLWWRRMWPSRRKIWACRRRDPPPGG